MAATPTPPRTAWLYYLPSALCHPGAALLLYPWSLVLLVFSPALRQVSKGNHHTDLGTICITFSSLYHDVYISTISTAPTYSASSDHWDHCSSPGFHIPRWPGKCPKEENGSECVVQFLCFLSSNHQSQCSLLFNTWKKFPLLFVQFYSCL